MSELGTEPGLGRHVSGRKQPSTPTWPPRQGRPSAAPAPRGAAWESARLRARTCLSTWLRSPHSRFCSDHLEVLKRSLPKIKIKTSSLKTKFPGFPGGAVVENLPANAGDTGSSPGLGGSHMPRSS